MTDCNNAIENVAVNSDGTEITFTMQDGTKLTILQPFKVNRSYDPTSFCLMAISAAMLHAYDRIAILERTSKATAVEPAFTTKDMKQIACGYGYVYDDCIVFYGDNFTKFCEALEERLAALQSTQAAGEPVAWVRKYPDTGELSGDWLWNDVIEQCRKDSGVWFPLGFLAAPQLASGGPDFCDGPISEGFAPDTPFNRAPQAVNEQQPVPQLFADTGDAVRGTFGKTVFAEMSNSDDLWPVWLDGWLRASEQQAAREVSDAAILACAFVINGICLTRPQDTWLKAIETRIRYMLAAKGDGHAD